ncbi:MAG: HAD family phosphatase [Ruminococcus sp.]|nr:HAD family phosphatase [Ruminococcus sp.]
MIKGVLFDMDGLILDTEKLLSRFWCESAQSFGYPMTPEHVLGIRSLSAKYSAPHLRSIFGEDFDYDAVRARRIELMNAYIAENGVELKPGIHSLLDYIDRSGLKCAVCTATDSQRTKRYLSSVDILDRFDELVCGDMIARGKPMPDTYIQGAAILGLEPKECIALEDSPNGIESAYQAGCKVVMVPDLSQPDDELRKKLIGVCRTLADVAEVIEQAK